MAIPVRYRPGVFAGINLKACIARQVIGLSIRPFPTLILVSNITQYVLVSQTHYILRNRIILLQVEIQEIDRTLFFTAK